MNKLAALCLGILILFGTIPANANQSIRLKNGNLKTNNNLEQFLSESEVLQIPTFHGEYHLLLQFNDIPTQQEREQIESTGIKLVEYLPKNAYIVEVPESYDLEQLRSMDVFFAGPIPTAIPLHTDLYTETYPAHAMVSSTRIRLQILPYRGQDEEAIKEALIDYGVDVFKDPNYPEKISIEVDLWQIDEIAAAPFTYFLAPIDVEPELENLTSRSVHRANAIDNMMPGGYRYDGSGINVGLQDDGFIGPHADYQGRLTHYTATNGGNHGDHVAGTIMGAGNIEPRNKGMAPGADIYVGYYFQINGNMTNYYNNDSIYITSASLGATCNGGYDGNSVTRDQQINSMPKLMHVFSAGNSQGSNCGYGAGSGWGTITGGHKQAKNLIAVGALDHNDGMSGYSSWGPAEDGRLKPEVTARGSSVVSTGTGNAYYTASGTSMACPGTSGSLAQLYHAFRELNSQNFADSYILKAIMMNTCEDLGNAGPDYRFGYGRINNLRALEVLENNWYTLGTVSQGGSNNFNINVPANVAELKVMVYWHDYEGNPAANQALVNDLNMSITAPGPFVYQPWILDPTANATNLNTPAIRGVDTLNNHEQITITGPTAGSHQVTIAGTSVPQGPQDYIITYTFIYDSIYVTYPMGGESFEPGYTEKIRWDAHGNIGNFTLEYSLNNGSSWTTVTTGIAGSRRYYDWTVPSTITSQALIRISRSGLVGVNDTFSIMDIPTGLAMSDKCPSIGTLTWNAVPGATSYDIFVLGNKYMDSIGTTSNLFFDIGGLTNGVANWYSVRARVGGAVGMRADAIEYTHTGTGSCFPYDLSVSSLVSPSGGCGLTANETVTIQITNVGTDSIPSGTPITIRYRLNGGAMVTQVVNLASQLDNGNTANLTFSTTGDFSPVNNTINIYATTAGDNFAGNDSLVGITLTNIPVVNTFPYLEDFETDSGNWYSSGILNEWEWGTPAGPVINTNAPGGTKSWMTDLNGNYPDNSTCYVQSPCFDLSSLTTPWIRMDINVDIEFSWDGVLLQTSTNSGASWNTLGALGDPNNWYNDGTVNALAATDPAQDGWTGNSGGWISASRELTGLGGQSSVWIRFVFASDGRVNEDGFAFDNIEIFEPFNNDIGSMTVNAPGSAPCLSSAEAVNVSIQNYGAATQTVIPMAYEVSGPINSGVQRDTINASVGTGVIGTFTFGPTTDMSSPGVYTVTAWSELPTDQDNTNDTVSTTVTNIAAISTFPWNEDFESFTVCGNVNTCNLDCGPAVSNDWVQDDNDQQDWRVDQGGTASNNTGPSQDHDPGTAQGKYIYTEASGGCGNQTMNIETPCFDLSGLNDARFAFFYHMFGGNTGSIYLESSTDNGLTWTTLRTLTGEVQTTSAQAWIGDTVDISSLTGTVKFRFRGVTGGGFESDMAIDAVQIFDIPAVVDVEVSQVITPTSGSCGNATSSVQVVIRNNGAAPASNVPVNFDITGPLTTGLVTEIAAGPVPAGDTIQYTFTATGNLGAQGNYILTSYTTFAVDGNLANDTSTSAIAINDATPPTISCPSNITVNAAGGTCAATVNYSTPTFSDNCSGASINRIAGPASGASFPVGSTTVTYRATDAAGNTSNCSFTVTVTDNQNPTISCPSNITANAAAGTCSATVTYSTPSFGDNCPGASISRIAGPASGASFPVGSTTVTHRVTDAAGLTATCSFTVTVTDNQNPTISCPSNITANTAAGMCTANVTYSTPTFGDNCPGASINRIAGPASGSSFPLGATTVTHRVTDAAGNTADCSFTVTVNDNESPVLNCPSNITVNANPGACGANVSYAAVTATDNCASPSANQVGGLASGAFFPWGTTSLSFNANDGNGNIASCGFTVTVIPADSVQAGFTYTATGLMANFTNTSVDASTYLWDFGDGSSSSMTSPSHTFASAGSYTVCLIANGACESDTICQLVTVSSTAHTWTGTNSSAWSDPGNWSNNAVPTASCGELDVLVPSGMPNDPILDGNYSINHLQVMAGASITIPTGDTLDLCGNITQLGTINMGPGVIRFSGSTAQSYNGNSTLGIVIMDNSAGLNFTSGATLRCAEALIMVQGDIDVPSSADLVLRSTATGTAYLDDFNSGTAGSITNGAGAGDVTVERWVVNPNNAFHFISPAVSPATVSGWSDDFTIYGPNNAQVVPMPNCDPTALAAGSPFGGLFEYRENAVTTCYLEGWHVRSAGPLTHGSGYAGIIPNNRRIELTGPPGTGAVVHGPLTRTVVNTSSAVGWNQVGNPYPSPLNWPDVAAANPGLGATAYIWNSSGFYGGTMQPLSALIPSDNIASSQGFQVEVLGPAPQSVNIAFDNTMRRTGNTSFQRNGSQYDQRLDLLVTGNGFADKTHIVFLDGPTNGWDGDFDGRKCESNAGQPTIFSKINSEMMSINARPEFDHNGASVDVGLLGGATGSFDLSLGTFEGFPFGTMVLLEDKQLNVFQNLLVDSTYSVTVGATNLATDYTVHFTPPVKFSSIEESCDKNDGSISIDLGTFVLGGSTFEWDSIRIAGANFDNTYLNASGVLSANSLGQGQYLASFYYQGYQLDTVLELQGASLVEAGFQADKTILEVGEQINLTDQATGASTMRWDLGDGTWIQNVNNLVHSYLFAGTYTITQEVSSQDCFDQTSIDVTVMDKTTGVILVDNLIIQAYSVPGHVSIKINGEPSAPVHVSIYDLNGSLILKEDLHSSKLIPWDFAQGHYLIRIRYQEEILGEKLLLH